MRNWLNTSTALACVLGFPAVAAASSFEEPTGLAPGSTYRLIFVTSDTTTATSSNIATYNTLANTDANLPAAVAFGLPSSTWSAVAGTDTVSALSNISVGCTGSCLTDPIYLVNGTEVATSQAALFSAPILTDIDLTEVGGAAPSHTGYYDANYVWTGSNPDGSLADVEPPYYVYGLGDSSGYAGAGLSDSTSYYLDDGNDTQTIAEPIYAISGELTVPSANIAAPEPMSAALLLTGGVMTGLARIRRRKARAAG
jgi:hypothetical protein